MNPEIEQLLWLVYNGIPWDVAHDLDPIWKTAFSIKFSEFNGAKFNYRTMQFVKET